jgi:hypothetical protein
MKRFIHWLIDPSFIACALLAGVFLGNIMGISLLEQGAFKPPLTGTALLGIGIMLVVVGCLWLLLLSLVYWGWEAIAIIIRKTKNEPIDITIQNLYNSLSQKNRDLADQILIKLEEEDARSA